ncbi:MAG: tripartite tricarboxylate transporter substrate binding protein [Proteobacteria bacterium]|nr:tripartite tricarboxylate transporter substrate binding protein [Burkholderiales bacterium]
MKFRMLVCASALLVALPGGARAADATQKFPLKPIRMVMPNAPGSGTDTLGRIVAQGMGEVLGQQVIIDNRPGAGGTLGMEIGKSANPDGYTVIFASPPALTVAPFVQKRQPFDPMTDFEYITTIGVTPNVLIVSPSLGVNSVAELVELARAKKGSLNMASAGPGSQSHLAGALLLSLGRFDSLHVPFKGGAAVPSVMTGETHWSINPAPSVIGMLRGGKLKALGHTLPARTALLPDMPTIAESVPGYSYSAWNGVIAPRGTPRALLDRLRNTLVTTMARPEVRSAMAGQATEIMLTTPEAFRKLVQETIVHNVKLVKALGLTTE